MFKRRKSILCLLIAVLMMASASTAAMAASPYETRYNNTVMASSVASISESGPWIINFKELEEKRLKARSQLMLRRKRWGCFGRALILDSPIINGSMLYMIIYTTEPIHSS